MIKPLNAIFLENMSQSHSTYIVIISKYIKTKMDTAVYNLESSDPREFVCLFVTDATLLSRRVPNEGTRSIARESVSYI